MTRKTEKNVKTVALELDEVKHALVEQKDFLVPVVQEAMQAVLEMEMEEGACFEKTDTEVVWHIASWFGVQSQPGTDT